MIFVTIYKLIKKEEYQGNIKINNNSGVDSELKISMDYLKNQDNNAYIQILPIL